MAGDDAAEPAPTKGPSPQDEERLAAYAAALADAVEATLAGWVERCITVRCEAADLPVDAAVRARAAAAGEAVRHQVGPEVRRLLFTDIDVQQTNPLAVLRRGVAEPTRVLQELGVPAVARDAFDATAFPEDRYDLSPRSFDDVDPALHDLGLQWGAAKAYVFLARRRAEGRR